MIVKLVDVASQVKLTDSHWLPSTEENQCVPIRFPHAAPIAYEPSIDVEAPGTLLIVDLAQLTIDRTRLCLDGIAAADPLDEHGLDVGFLRLVTRYDLHLLDTHLDVKLNFLTLSHLFGLVCTFQLF